MADTISSRARKPADPSTPIDVSKLVDAYFTGKPDPAVPAQCVAFGTSGHRGSAFNIAFNENHIPAITQAICLHRNSAGITGPLLSGFEAHARPEPTLAAALGVFATNDVEGTIDARGGYTKPEHSPA